MMSSSVNISCDEPPTVKAPLIEKMTLTSAEAIGFIVRSYDCDMAFEKVTQAFVMRWGFDPSLEDLRKHGRKSLVRRVETKEASAISAKLLAYGENTSLTSLRRNLIRDLFRYERHQTARSQLWSVASQQLWRWMVDGLIVGSGRPAFLDGKYFAPGKSREDIDPMRIATKNTQFVPVAGSKAEGYRIDYWLVCNYVSLSDDPFREYHSPRPSWGEVEFERNALFSMLRKPGSLLPENQALSTTTQLNTCVAPSRSASRARIREVIHSIYKHAIELNMRLPNVKTIGDPVQEVLRFEELECTKNRIQQIAYEPELAQYRRKPGRRYDPSVRPFSLEGIKNSGLES